MRTLTRQIYENDNEPEADEGCDEESLQRRCLNKTGMFPGTYVDICDCMPCKDLCTSLDENDRLRCQDYSDKGFCTSVTSTNGSHLVGNFTFEPIDSSYTSSDRSHTAVPSVIAAFIVFLVIVVCLSQLKSIVSFVKRRVGRRHYDVIVTIPKESEIKHDTSTTAGSSRKKNEVPVADDVSVSVSVSVPNQMELVTHTAQEEVDNELPLIFASVLILNEETNQPTRCYFAQNPSSYIKKHRQAKQLLRNAVCNRPTLFRQHSAPAYDSLSNSNINYFQLPSDSNS